MTKTTSPHLLGIRAVIAALALLLATSSGCAGGDGESAAPAVRLVPGTDAIVRATVVDDTVGVQGYETEGLLVHVDELLWVVGDAVVAGQVTTMPAPVAGTDLLVMPRGVRPAAGTSVVVLLSYLSLPDGSQYDSVRGVLWFIVLVADSLSGIPVKGTDTATVEALDSALLGPGETDRIAALIDLVAESAATLRAQNLGESKPFTPRADRVQAALLGPPPTNERPSLDDWLSIDAATRPLAVTGDSIIEGSAEALGVEWVRIEAQVLYDVSLLGKYPAVVLDFRDVGILGVFHLDPRLQYGDPVAGSGAVAATPVFGWAPRGAGFTLVGLAPDGVTRTELLEVPPSDAAFFLIDLRGGMSSQPLTENGYFALVAKMSPGG